jgi:chitosanase
VPLSSFQEEASKAIVNIFETGRLKGDYGRVTVAANDPGHLSYGRSQTTLASGNLHVLINKYCNEAGARFAEGLTPYLSRLRDKDLTLDNDMELRQILVKAGDDPAMQTAQNGFFDAAYWKPANTFAANLGLTSALGITTVYDSIIHGSFHRIRAQTIASLPANPPEKDWIDRYLSLRRAWLASHANTLLRRTVYRMDSLKALIDAQKWELEAPFSVRGIQIDANSFEAARPDAQGEEPTRSSAEDPDQVVLMLRRPYQRGAAVELLQGALVKQGLLSQASVDGVFGPMTAELVKEFQRKHHLVDDGVVGAATWTVVNEVMAV